MLYVPERISRINSTIEPTSEGYRVIEEFRQTRPVESIANRRSINGGLGLWREQTSLVKQEKGPVRTGCF